MKRAQLVLTIGAEPALADVSAGTNIGFQTVDYASSGATAMQYKIVVEVQRIQ